jgi:hypothetical protein
MNPATQQGRHLSRSALEAYLTQSAPAALLVPGDPECRIIVDPSRRQLTLRTPQDRGGTPDLADFEHVAARTVAADGRRWFELIVDYGEQGHEAYLLIGDAADMIQQNGMRFEAAVRAALSTFEDLLTRASALSTEKQTGLYGELLFLESLLTCVPPDAAVEAWKGFAPNEHDFVLPGVCFEIKTTSTERRRHRISGLQQLQPVTGTALWLVSVQLTTAGPGSGRTLEDLVDEVRHAAEPARASLDAALARAGWRERDRPLYRRYLTLRSVPAAFRVDAGFPVLDRRIVDEGCSRPELIVDADYTIDLTSLERGTPPAPADLFVREDS